MTDLLRNVESPQEIAALAQGLRGALQEDRSRAEVLEFFERWAAALDAAALNVPGAAFLQLWLRRGTLQPILERELGPASLRGGWREDGRARLKIFPLGVVGHWPAGNIAIQPVLSMSCALLGGNACLVRVPRDLVEPTRHLIRAFASIDATGVWSRRLALVAFGHERLDLHQAMAEAVDGAMIWGGAEAVSSVRALPFPPWARLAVFGPRLSVAAMDASAWRDKPARPAWCQRLARDLWQFDQQACSSPQTLFLQGDDGVEMEDFVVELRRAFEAENRLHPRQDLPPAMASAICLARASWLLENVAHGASFPMSPDWTILLGTGTDLPKPTQGRTLSVLLVEDLFEVVSKFDGSVQTLGLAIGDPQRERLLAEAAGRKGVDRVVKLGRMHVFSSPWDGMDLVRPMVRVVRHVPSQDEQQSAL